MPRSPAKQIKDFLKSRLKLSDCAGPLPSGCRSNANFAVEMVPSLMILRAWFEISVSTVYKGPIGILLTHVTSMSVFN